MIHQRLQSAISTALSKLDIDVVPQITSAANTDHGDFSTNIALVTAGQKDMKSMELAQVIAKNISYPEYIKEVSIAPPGFINIKLTDKAFISELQENESVSTKLSQIILIEFGQPNTHKSPHIGHLFSYIYGESIARILTADGNTIWRANYQGDIGPHVARCLWSLQKIGEKYPKKLIDRVTLLQKCYQDGSTQYEESESAKKEINEINNALYLGENKELVSLWKETRQWSVDYYQQFESELGIAYDRSFFESEVWKLGKKIVTQNIPDVFVESEGATIFNGENYGLHTRVFLNKNQQPTYEAKELGLAFTKQQEFPDYDVSLTTTAMEQNQYFNVVFKAIEQIDPALSKKLKHIGFGLINLTTGKMASRSGQIITAFSLVENVTEEIIKEYKSDQKTAKIIALAAIKYAFLRSDARSDKKFDIKTSIAREGDSGPYILYTYVRMKSILAKAKEKENTLNDVYENGGEESETHESVSLSSYEKDVIRIIMQYTNAQRFAAQTYSPHIIANYLYSLAKATNAMYQEVPILTSTNNELVVKLRIVKRVSDLLQGGLAQLGIETVEKM